MVRPRGSMAGDRQFLLDLVACCPALQKEDVWASLTADTDLRSLRTGEGNRTSFGGGTFSDPAVRINPAGRVTHINLEEVEGLGGHRPPASLRNLTELEHLHLRASLPPR